MGGEKRKGSSVDPDRKDAQRFGYGSVATRFRTPKRFVQTMNS